MTAEEPQEQPAPAEPGQEQAPPGPEPSQEELRRQLEEELRRVRVQDLVLQSVVSIINLTARRIGKEDERDLDQARVGIEAVRALVGLLDDEPQSQVRSALSELQMLYARQAPGDEAPAEASQGMEGGGEDRAQEEARTKARAKLWTPPNA
jgi:hypothetical protein